MKKVISGNELKEKMDYAVNLLCDTVKTTLGPSGNNIIIDHSTFSPFITNDGVTIAQNIESDDEVVNTILELAKESSIKTNEIVGDGTTTTLVFLQSIYNDGVNYINKGINPITLKNELNNSISKYIDKINEYSHIPNDKELINIAKISSNDDSIGNIIGNVYLKLKSIDAIKIIEGDNDKVEYLNGYKIDTTIASPLFLKDLKELNYSNASIMITNKIIEDINDIGDVLNIILSKHEPLIIIGEYSNLFINQILSMNTEINSFICLLQVEEYGNKKISVLKDICAITNSKIIDYKFSMDYIGKIKNIKIDKESTIFNFNKNINIKNRIEEIKNNELIDNIEFMNKRIAMFENGLANIYVSSPTITERREKKMRYDDALCAIESAKEGIVLGSGITLLKVKNNITPINIGDKIISNALEKPFNQIMINSGLNYNEISKKIEENNYNTVFNINTNKLEQKSEVIDAKKVIINAIINATSIASMLLTTTSIVINEYKNNMCKTNDYNEL